MKPLSLESRIKQAMHQYDFRFRKKWGQNFLIDENILDRIVATAQISETDKVLEIGAGMGFLSEKLAAKAGLVTAVELDPKLCQVLDVLAAKRDNLIIRQGDGLKLDFEEIKEESEANGFSGPFKIVANLPYYITTPLIFYFLQQAAYWCEMTLMVQKEVAQRLVASPGTKDYGVLSLMVAYAATAEIAFTVPPQAFRPRPKVDSALLRLQKIAAPPVAVKDKKVFQSLVQAGFGQRRKTLANALNGGGFDLSKDEIMALLEACNIDPKQRGETLSFGEYAELANGLSERQSQ